MNGAGINTVVNTIPEQIKQIPEGHHPGKAELGGEGAGHPMRKAAELQPGIEMNPGIAIS